MTTDQPGPSSALSCRGFHLPQTPLLLQDSLQVVSTLCGALAVLLLQDESGVWYHDASGLSADRLEAVAPVLALNSVGERERHLLLEQGLETALNLDLVAPNGHGLGTLWLLSPTRLALDEPVQSGLLRLVNHVQLILRMDHETTTGQPPTLVTAAFIRGLLHELGSFIFGISATFDAFEVRLPAGDESGKYIAILRKGLGQMTLFVTELREFLYPRPPVVARLDLERLLRDVLEQLRPQAEARAVGLHLQVEGALPDLQGDEVWLRTAFLELLGILLRDEPPGSQLTLRLNSDHSGGESRIVGCLDASSVKFSQMDPARLFEPFYFKGSGLGRLTLPGVRRAFESHGGSLESGPGTEGLRIRFMLPSKLPYSLPLATQY